MRTKLVMGASLALLFASCNTLQKVSKTAKDVKEIGETIYDFKPKKEPKKKKEVRQQVFATWEKEFLYENTNLYEKKIHYFFLSNSDDIYVANGKTAKKINLGNLNSKKFDKYIKSLINPSKNGYLLHTSKIYRNDSLISHYEVVMKDKKPIDSTYVEIISNF